MNWYEHIQTRKGIVMLVGGNMYVYVECKCLKKENQKKKKSMALHSYKINNLHVQIKQKTQSM